MSPWGIVPEAVTAFRKGLTSMVVPLILAFINGGRMQIVFICISVAIPVLITLSVTLRWLGTRYGFSDESFRIQRGLLSTKQARVSWNDVRSVTSSTGIILDRVGCARVAVTPYATADLAFDLDAVTKREADAIIAAFHASRTRPAVASAESPSAAPQAVPLSDSIPDSKAPHPKPANVENKAAQPPLNRPLRPVEHLIIGLRYGKFLWFVPILLGPLHELGVINFDRDTWDAVTAGFLSLQAGLIVGGIVVVIALGLLLGAFLSWNRFGGLQVSRTDDGFGVRAGRLGSEYQVIPRANIAAVQIEQTLVMRLVGRAEVRVIVGGGSKGKDDADGTFEGVLLPLASLTEALDLTEDIVGVRPDLAAVRPQHSLGHVLRALPVAVVIAAIALAPFLWWGWWWPLYPVLAIAVLVPASLAGGKAAVAISGPRSDLVLRRKGVLSHQFTLWREGGIHQISLRSGPVNRLMRTATLVVHYRAGSAVEVALHLVPLTEALRILQSTHPRASTEARELVQ